jgi:hypothetical protein
MQYPMPEVDEARQPPFMIRLEPWGAATAEELHQQFGDDIELTVGALPHPPGRQPPRPPAAGPLPDLLDPHKIAAELADPAVVSSGHTLQHGLLLRNRTGRELQIATNGGVTAVVVDPHAGEVVGGFAAFQNRPLIIFAVAPGQTERLPLLIGTASCTPRLGYAIPPGDWESRPRSLSARPRASFPACGPRSCPSPSLPEPPPCRGVPGDHRNCRPRLDTILPGRPHLLCELQLKGRSLATLFRTGQRQEQGPWELGKLKTGDAEGHHGL